MFLAAVNAVCGNAFIGPFSVFRVADILSILSAIGGIGGLATIIGLAYWLGGKFREIDLRFNEIDQRFNEINRRFQEIDQRFKRMEETMDLRFKEVDSRFKRMEEGMNRRFNEIDQRFREIDQRFNGIDIKFSEIDSRFQEIDQRFRGIEESIQSIDRKIKRLGDAFSNYQEFFIEYLTTESVLKPRSARLLIGEARRLMSLAVSNPLTKEEKNRLKELFEKSEKEELTVDEAYEFLDLVRKVLDEYWDRPEAWKLHIYAAMMVGLAIKREEEREEKEEQKSS